MEIVFIILYSLIGAVIAQVIGAIWYSEKVFGKKWMKLIGKTRKEIEKDMKNKKSAALKYYLPSFVSAFVYSLFLILITRASETSELLSTSANFLTVILLFALFVMPTAYSSYVYEDRNKGLFALYYGYVFVSVMVITLFATIVY